MSDEIRAVYRGQLRCEATHMSSDDRVSTDAPLELGGGGLTFSPTDLVSTALGTCILTILGGVADRHDVDLSGTTVSVTKELIDKPSLRIGRLVTIVTFPVSAQLDEAMWDRLTTAARHCPVHKSLHPDIDAPIEFRTGP